MSIETISPFVGIPILDWCGCIFGGRKLGNKDAKPVFWILNREKDQIPGNLNEIGWTEETVTGHSGE